MPERLELSRPVMGRPARFEDYLRRWLLREEQQKAIAGETPFVIDVARSMRDSHLKHGLCEIDGDGRMLHGDSSLPWPSRGRFTWHDDAASAGGVPSIVAPDGAGESRSAAGDA
jgi:hypothetical protein